MKPVLFGLCLLFFLTGNCQQQAVQWGTYEKTQRKIYGKEIIHQNDHYTYVLERENRNLNFLFFQVRRSPDLIVTTYENEKLQKVNRNKLKLPRKGKVKYKYAFLDFLEMEGKLLLFLKAIDPKTKNIKLLAQEISTQGEQLGLIYELDEGVAEIDPQKIFNRKKTMEYDVSLAPDKLSFAVVGFNPSQENAEKKITLKYFDVQLNSKWQREIQLPFKEDFFEVVDFQIGNKGELVLLGKVWTTEQKIGLTGKVKTKVTKKSKGKANYSFACLFYDSKTNQLNQTNIRVGSNYLTDVAMSYQYDTQKIHLAGFYSTQWGGSIRGVFSKLIDANDHEIVRDKFKEFSPEFLSLFLSKRKLKKLNEGKAGNYELKDYHLDHFTVKKDGSALLLAELFYVQVNTSTTQDPNGFMRTTTNYSYHYDDIMAIHLDSNGVNTWSAKIQKRQLSYNDGGPFSSYLFNVQNDMLYVLFNDHPKNNERIKNKESLKKMTNAKKSSTVLVTIDNQGKLSRKQLFLNKETGVVIKPKSSWYQKEVYKKKNTYFFGLNQELFSRTKFKLGVLNFPSLVE